MEQESWNDRLSRISTMWTLVYQSHAVPADAATTAQRLLMQRYHGSVYRYLLGALRDEDAALELFQEFALRFLRGDFRRADPERGRFRDYVKTALIHLVDDYRKSERVRPGPLPEDLPGVKRPATQPEDPDRDFIISWREELLNRTWQALREANSTFHAVLLLQVQDPDSQSPQKAEQLAVQLGRSITPTQFRVTLHRAREKFADLLLEEVANSLEACSDDELVQELRELHLLKLCSPALERRGHSPSKKQ